MQDFYRCLLSRTYPLAYEEGLSTADDVLSFTHVHVKEILEIKDEFDEGQNAQYV